MGFEVLSLFNQIAPFIQYECYLSECISPDDVYKVKRKALEHEVGDVHDFLFELDDLVPAAFDVVRQATLLWYSVSFSESARLGSEHSGFTVLDEEFAGPQAIFDVLIRGAFPNLRRLEFDGDEGSYVDVTPLFDVVVEYPERFPALEYVSILNDWLPLEHKIYNGSQYSVLRWTIWSCVHCLSRMLGSLSESCRISRG